MITTGTTGAILILTLFFLFFPSTFLFFLGFLHGLWDRITGKPYENPGEREDPS